MPTKTCVTGMLECIIFVSISIGLRWIIKWQRKNQHIECLCILFYIDLIQAFQFYHSLLLVEAALEEQLAGVPLVYANVGTHLNTATSIHM